MSETIEILLPKPAAEKLFGLRTQPGNRHVVENLEKQLATLGVSGARFAMAPPVLLTVAGGAYDLIVKELRVQIAVIGGRLDHLAEGETDDAEAAVFVSALTAHRLQLERREEAVISRAAAEGIVVERRPDADAMAVLGLVEFEQAAAA